MKGIGTFVVVLLFLTVPLAGIGSAQPGDDPLAGLKNACVQSGNDNPCEKAGVIQDQTVEDGETRTYADGEFTAEGTVVVEDGGTVVVDDATITFKDSSDGFIVQSGGTLQITDSTFQEDAEGSDYGIDAQAGSTLVLTTSNILGGSGVDLATSDAEVSSNRFEEIPLALHLLEVTVNITGNHFVNNNVAVNETGGAPTLYQNVFEGGQICVRNWRTNPNITSNTFRGCHVGIFHEQSHSDIVDNDMEDEIEPPGAGIVVKDTLSPNILNNRISRYGTGILVLDGRAFIRDNTLFDNVAAGVRILRNSAPMDITDNHIFGNGGEGILLEDTQDVELAGNDIHDNGGVGAFLIESFGAEVRGNFFSNHTVQMNLTGGDPLVTANHFTGGEVCMRNWRTNPNITSNTFRGCHIGIFHEQSHSDILDNDMEDEIEPPGAGIWVQDTFSPRIEGNRIAKYGVGIVIQDARAFVRGNTMTENVAAGVSVLRNSAPMDITDNHIFGNGGEGILLEDTDDIEISGNDIHDNGGVGAFLIESFGAELRGNSFSNHTVQVNLTGGDPLVTANQFTGGEVCMRNYQTNPNITANTFRGCHIGIFHEQSHSDILDNDMEDEIEPPGAGIWVKDTLSPLIQNNRIAKYGVGVLVEDARAFVRGNTMTENVGAGVGVLRNSAPMDITDNHIFANGGEGIFLKDTHDIEISGNDIHDNGGLGAHVIDSIGTHLIANSFANHAVQLNLTGAPSVPRLEGGSTPVFNANWAHLTLGVADDITDDCFLFDVTRNGITNNDIRLTSCVGKAAGSLVTDADTIEKSSTPTTAGALWSVYADVNNNEIYDAGDYVYVRINEGGSVTRDITAPSGSDGAWEYTLRLTPTLHHDAGTVVFAGDADLINFQGNVHSLPIEFGFLDADESDAFEFGDDAFLTNGAVAAGDEVPANSIVVHGADGFGTQTDADDGGPRVEANSFTGGDFCIRNWRTNPTIVGNTFRGCHVGIFHEQSHSDILDNDMEDEIEPPGAGIWVFDTESPVIENNRIARYGVGILVEDARAFIRNNEILENVDDGIRVIRNSGPMDIQGNDIHDNGGNGIEFHDALDILVAGNTVHNNTHNGLFANAAGLIFSDNMVADNGDTGVFLNDAPGASVLRNTAVRNGVEGILVSGPSDGAILHENVASDNGDDGIAGWADGLDVTDNTADNNGLSGIALFGDDGNLARNVATGNNLTGFYIRGVTNVVSDNDTAIGNAWVGFYVQESNFVNVSDVGAFGNQHGVSFVFGGTHRVEGGNASGNDLSGFSVNDIDANHTSNVILSFARAFNNMDGVVGTFHSPDSSLAARDGWYEGNTGAGVKNNGNDVVIDARNSYWGSPSGPTHPDNPDGTGDAVTGDVLFDPFRTSPPPECSVGPGGQCVGEPPAGAPGEGEEGPSGNDEEP